MTRYTIRPLSTGHYDEAELAFHYYLPDPRNAGVKIKVEYWMFLIEGVSSLILVDTGPGDPETWGRQFHHFYDRAPDQVPITALRKHGIEPQDIDIIINTHLHWANCHANHLFPSATIYVQADEVVEALDPVAPHRPFYTPPEARPPWMQTLNRTRLLKGTTEIIEGITAFAMPSHTIGFQSVLIETAVGPILLAGDMLPFFANWTGRWGMNHIPSGTMQASLRQYYRCFDLIERIDPVFILPGVDPKVAEREVYG